MISLKGKKNIILIITLITILISVFTPVLNVLADGRNANEKLNEEISDYVNGKDEFTDVIEQMQTDSKENANPNKNTILHIMKRLFATSEYLNDVEHGVLSNKLGVVKSDILYNNRYLCNPFAPNNLINHNCNIPNFTTDLIQTIANPMLSPFNNAGKTSSYASFGFGVPKNIPGGIVPIEPGHRSHTYTALELYGYNLPLISYNGEWDKIEVSSEARMLSNFGLIDKVTLMGTGLWESIKSGIGALIENFSFNPFRWSNSLVKTLEGSLTGGINVVIDTSDLNVVATNAWKRPAFSGTLYNVYVLTDKEVLIETNKRYFDEFIKKLQQKSEVSPELLEVLELEIIPPFTFDPLWETDESIAAREAAEAHNASESAAASADEEYSPSYVAIPEPVYYTEHEQLGFWAAEPAVADKLTRGARHGLISDNPSDYVEYEPLVEAWNEAWESYFSREFNALGDVVNDLIEESDLEVFLDNPHFDPKQGISHYACANPDGSIMKSGGRIEYLYLKNNKGEQEYLNPNCSLARPPIGSGLLGSGWLTDVPLDTRHINQIQNAGTNTSGSAARSFSSFLAQLTNTVIGLAFSPLMSELGIDVIVSELISGFRDTIFFPMASLIAAIGAVLLFLQLLKNSSAWQLLTSIFITFVIFVASATFLLHPEASLKIVDEIPTKIENFMASAILIEDDGTTYCSTGGEADGIRSAQCNVWGIMVFNPWVHLQYGAKYEDLYANGYTGVNGSTFQNTNGSLVGNAEVDMGGGYILNNWAMYQLDKTKAGTINNTSVSSLLKMGTVDKDLFRIVDLQAGPNNGAGTDSRFFKVWSGQQSSSSLGLLFILQAILVSITLISISFLKIEVSFIFAISLIFLPFVLLYGLLPQGKGKLRSYLSGLISMLLKRAVITMMLVVLLKIYTLSYSMVDSVTSAAYISIAISVAFMIYKKEILGIIIASESTKIKEMVSDTIPVQFKHNYQMAKSKAQGTVSGFVGGSIGSAVYKQEVKFGLRKTKKEIKDLEKESSVRPLNENENATLNQLKKDLEDAQRKSDFFDEKEQSSIRMGVLGTKSSSAIIGRRAERAIRKEGFTVGSIYSKVKEDVINEGAEKITTKEDPTSLDTYKELLSHSEKNVSKTSQQQLTLEEARLLRAPKIQKEVRRLAREREELSNANKDNKKYNATSPDIEELERIAKYIDRKRKSNKTKGTITNPYYEIKKVQAETKEKDAYLKVDSDVKSIIKEEIEKEIDRVKEKETETEQEERKGGEGDE